MVLLINHTKENAFLSKKMTSYGRDLRSGSLNDFFGIDQISDFITGLSEGLFGQFSIKKVSPWPLSVNTFLLGVAAAFLIFGSSLSAYVTIIQHNTVQVSEVNAWESG
jgi:hypothetical protein